MPKGYAIVTEEIIDQARYEGYGQKAMPTIMQYGGMPIVAYDNAEVLEGQWHGTRTIVVEFASVEAARRWYNSPEYQAIIGERHASTDSNFVIVGGFEMPNQ